MLAKNIEVTKLGFSSCAMLVYILKDLSINLRVITHSCSVFCWAFCLYVNYGLSL